MTRILIDMDGPSAEWHLGIESHFMDKGHSLTNLDWSTWDGKAAAAHADTAKWVKEAMATPGFYADLSPVLGLREAVNAMTAAGHDVWFCSTPDHTNPTCADDKIAWLEQHVGVGWGSRLILTHDKTLVRGDVLIDDKPVITGGDIPEWEHIVWDMPYNGPNSTDYRKRLFAWSEWALVVNLSIAQHSAQVAALTSSAIPASGEVRTVSSTGGEKGTKPQRYDLIPVLGMDLLAELYGNGAKKYAAHNWRRGYDWSNSYAAAMRHMTSFWNGEDRDPEMGLPHPISAVFHMFALVQFMEDYPEFDDRFKK